MTTLQPHSASLITNPFCQCDDPDVRPVYALHIFECGNCLRGFENAPDWKTWWAEVAAFVGEPDERDSAPVQAFECSSCDHRSALLRGIIRHTRSQHGRDSYASERMPVSA